MGGGLILAQATHHGSRVGDRGGRTALPVFSGIPCGGKRGRQRGINEYLSGNDLFKVSISSKKVTERQKSYV